VPFVKFLDENAGMAEIIMNRLGVMGPFSVMAEAIMRGPSAFTEADREIIGAFVSAANNCSFCYNSHAATAEAFGIDIALFDSLIENIDAAPIEESLKPVLHYVKKLNDTPFKMVQADADAVYAAGWDEKALSDAVMICAMFNMANRVVEGHGVNKSRPGELYKQGGKRLREHGYMPPVEPEKLG